MGRESEIGAVKHAWIDKEKRIISFSCLPNADDYRAEEPAFWQEIVLLMKSGYPIKYIAGYRKNSDTRHFLMDSSMGCAV